MYQCCFLLRVANLRLSSSCLLLKLILPSCELCENMEQGFIREGGYVVVHCDGSCPGNGQPGATGGIGVWFGENHPLNVSKPLNQEEFEDSKITNNIAEIKAAIVACLILKNEGEEFVLIRTDSRYMIDSMKKWIKKWKKNGWLTSKGRAVKNRDLYMELDELLCWFQDYDFIHVTSAENNADWLAKRGAELNWKS